MNTMRFTLRNPNGKKFVGDIIHFEKLGFYQVEDIQSNLASHENLCLLAMTGSTFDQVYNKVKMFAETNGYFCFPDGLICDVCEKVKPEKEIFGNKGLCDSCKSEEIGNDLIKDVL